VKWQHAIIYTGEHPPSPRSDELPTFGEYGMVESIRVKPKAKDDKLNEMARINFAKIYTIEHNVKVLEFGVVH
jgi:hypothetical protein